MEPLKKNQMKDYIITMLREEIFSGSIKDGEELVQEFLAEKLGVSRMPVREALLQLELEGVLQRLPNRHMRVVGMASDTVKQNFSVLFAVEKEIVSILVQEGKDIQFARDAFRLYQLAVPLQGTAECAKRELFFHNQLVRCLENPFLTQVYQKLSSGYFAYVLEHRKRHWKNILREFEQLLIAIEEKNLAASNQILQNYFEQATQAAIGGNPIDKPKAN